MLATGFETTKFASVIDFVGRGGTKLADAWSDVKPGAEAAYDETLHANIARVEPWQAGCSNYYRAPSGRVVTQWPGRMSELRQLLETPDWGDYEAGRFIPGDA